MRRLLLAVLKFLPIVAGTSVIAILALALIRSVVPTETLRISNNEVGNYLQTIGTIYAVLLAFVVQSVWAQFNEARTVVEREATQVIDLFRIVDVLYPDRTGTIHVALVRYVEAVIHREWKAMAKGDEATIELVGAELDHVWAGLHCFEPLSECAKSLHAEALVRFNDLSDARTNRLTAARTRMPSGLRLLLYIGAFVIVGSMGLLAVDRFVIHAIITGALAGSLSHVLYLVEDLDDAFAGFWRVSTDSFARALRHVVHAPPSAASCER